MSGEQQDAFDPKQGLIEYFSSQAALMIAQYENINQLLGPTDDWTGPGTHCEVLLRKFLRTFLPSRLNISKGFIYGRKDVGNGTKHCPEIDLLIHDTHHFAPLFQIDDFVIVQGKTVYGLIQVKRTMDSGKLKKALKNVVAAKDHFRLFCSPRSSISLDCFSGVVFFDEKEPRQDGRPSDSYANLIRETFGDPKDWHLAPDFIGSLKTHVFYRRTYGNDHLEYIGVPSVHDGHNIGLQVFLWKLSQMIGSIGCDLPFAFPKIDKSAVVEVQIRTPEEEQE